MYPAYNGLMNFSLSDLSKLIRDTSRCGRFLRILAFLLMGLWCRPSLAQGVAGPGGVCKPVSQRTQEVGCWIMADDPVGHLTKSPVFWHLDSYTTRSAALADKGPRSA